MRSQMGSCSCSYYSTALPPGPDVASGCLNEVQLWLLRSRCSEWHDRGVLPLPGCQPAHPHPHLRSLPALDIRSQYRCCRIHRHDSAQPKSELTWLTAMGAPRLDWECDLRLFRIKSSGTTDHDSAVVGWPMMQPLRRDRPSSPTRISAVG
jgi:hypothetical protein